MIDIDLVGSIHFWQLEVNSISIINLVMAVGLVVDYSAHVIHNFILQVRFTHMLTSSASNSLHRPAFVPRIDV